MALDKSKWPTCLLWHGWLPGLSCSGNRAPWAASFGQLAWGVAEEGNARLERCRAFMPVPGVLQSVQRAEFWGAILALQAYWPCQLGIDDLNVAGTIGRLLDRVVLLHFCRWLMMGFGRSCSVHDLYWRSGYS